MNNILADDHISLLDFRSKVINYKLRCTPRDLIVVPAKVQWEWIHEQRDVHVKWSNDCKETKNPSLALRFQLPSGSYATCAVRELCRRPLEQ